MVRVKDYIPDIAVELKYATTDNFTGQVIYTFTEAYLRYGTVKKLAQVQETLKSYGFGLKIWDAFRPLYGQQALWDAYPNANFVSRPGTGVRAHCRGHAVDITMVDLQGNDVEMPSGFDDFTALGDKDYADCSEAAAYHAGLLDSVMKAHGFSGYKREWWHYVDTVDYPIEDYFDPAAVSA
ncbi:MAG: D-alanyl-D-alanine dipeptidase [Ruminococcaceae bacterium]|nr:D-alanyl-D-alanine dipeptidase [Oscillospiraceae bacterium]